MFLKNKTKKKCHKYKWCLLFFTRIKSVAFVLACTRSVARIKWRRLIKVITNNKKALPVDFFPKPSSGAHTIHGIFFRLRKPPVNKINRYNVTLR